MSVATQELTAEDHIRMPDDGLRYELVKGELRQMPPAGAAHGYVAVQVAWRLAQHVEAGNLGAVFAAETGFKIAKNPDTVRAPDVAFVSRERIEQSGIPPGYWPGAPDLAVEVVAPCDSYVEVEEEVLDWLEAGTRMVIVVNPGKRVVSVYRALKAVVLTANDTLSGEDVVPGWSVPVKDLFG